MITTDILVIGFGVAGACAAITAHDFGANIILIEKQHEYSHLPTTRMSDGDFHSPPKEGLFDKSHRIFGFDENTAKIWEEFCPDNENFLKSLDPTFSVEYKNVKNFRIAESQNFKSNTIGGESFYSALKLGIQQRKIECYFNSSLIELIIEKNIVIGATILHNQEIVTIFVKKSIIVATGGFEYSEDLLKKFYPSYYKFYGSSSNTGDGTVALMKIGAELNDITALGKMQIVMINGQGMRMNRLSNKDNILISTPYIDSPPNKLIFGDAIFNIPLVKTNRDKFSKLVTNTDLLKNGIIQPYVEKFSLDLKFEPRYEMLVYQGSAGTKNGIKTTWSKKVLTTSGVIDNLYAIGSISSVFQHSYESGGNLAEGIVFGRYVGRCATHH